MIPALSTFSLQGNPPLLPTTVSGGHFRLAEHHHLIEWLPGPAAYSFTQSGAGDDSIERPNPFTHVVLGDTPKDLHATVEGVAKVKHSRNLVVSRGVHNKRLGSRSKPKFADCLSYQKTLIKMAAEDAKKLLAEAVTVSERIMTQRSSEGEDNYKLWLGRYSQQRADKIWYRLEKLRTNIAFLGFTYDCNCDEAFPSEISELTLQLWDRCSVTDKSLVQSPTAVESGSADPSGTSGQMKNRLDLSAWPASSHCSWISNSA